MFYLFMGGWSAARGLDSGCPMAFLSGFLRKIRVGFEGSRSGVGSCLY